MVVHELKTWPEYFQPIVDGTKTFDIRKDDRDFRVGDVLKLREYEPDRDEYTGRIVYHEIGFLIKGMWGVPKDVCVMSLLPCDAPKEGQESE
jgi:hypothetical protein